MRSLTAAVVCVLFISLAYADEGRPTRATAPLTLADFEDDASLALWRGIPHKRTQTHAVSGGSAMTFDIPQYTKGDEERPRVVLPFDHGRGFPFRDFRGYASIAVDVWVEGDHPGALGLKLRDSDGEDSWTTHITVEPGKWNTAALSIEDAAADINVEKVDEIVLYALRPKTAFTLVVDQLRLIPFEMKPDVATFSLVYPNYRGWIMPDGGAVTVTVAEEFAEHGIDPRDVRLEASLTVNGKSVTSRRPWRKAKGMVDLQPTALPDGDATLRVALVQRKGGSPLAEQTWNLCKLSLQEQKALTSYVDRSNNLMVNGKPFFPLGWYTNTKEQYLDEVADSPFNCLLAYGTNHVRKDDMLKFLDRMHAHGLKLIYCLNDVYPTATYFEQKSWEGINGNDAIAHAVVEAYRDHPAILAWYLNDELPHRLVPQLEDYYQRVKTLDPRHPCFIVLCNRSEFRYFPTTTDILGVDPYPIPKDPVTRVSGFADEARKAMGGVKPVWLVPQAFAWYQYNSENKDRGHIPTEEELRTGRAPTYEEGRCMTYLALIHGAKGLIYYCYYDMRVLPQYAEMWEWMKAIGKEVETLMPVLLSSDDRGEALFSPAAAPIHTRLKAADGRLYLMAVNAGNRRVETEFALPVRAKTVDVLFEGRTIIPKGKRFTDAFEPLEAHVYDLGAAP